MYHEVNALPLGTYLPLFKHEMLRESGTPTESEMINDVFMQRSTYTPYTSILIYLVNPAPLISQRVALKHVRLAVHVMKHYFVPAAIL